MTQQQGRTGLADRATSRIGRDALIADLATRVRAPGAVVVIDGEPGSGKTTVWRAVLEQLQPDWQWTARCAAAEADLGLGVLADFLASVPAEVLAELPSPQRRAVDVVLYRTDVEGGAPIPDRLLRTVTAVVLTALTERGSVVVGLDDVQWCDPASLAAFVYALERVEHDVTLFATARADAVPELPRSEILRVPPLGHDDVATLVRQVAPDAARATVEDVVRRAAGNPYFATELARALAGGGAAASIPGTLRLALGRRFADLTAHTRRRLLELAVRGVAPAAEFTTAELAEAFRRGLLGVEGDAVRFTHPLLPEVLLDDADPVERRTAHADAAAAVDDPVARVLHRAQAEPASAELAAELDAAAVTVTGRGDPEGALRLARLALDRTPGGARPAHRLFRLMELYDQLAISEECTVVAVELLAVAETPEQCARAGIFAAVRLGDHLTVARAQAELARLPGLTPEQAARTLTEAAMTMREGGALDEALAMLQAWTAELAPTSQAYLLAAGVLVNLARLAGRPNEAPDPDTLLASYRQLAAREELSSVPLQCLAGPTVFDDRFELAQDVLVEARRLAYLRGEIFFVGSLFAQRALRMGDLDAALALQEQVGLARSGLNLVFALSRLAVIHSWRGAHAQALNLITAAERALPDPDDIGAAWVAYARGLNALLRGDAPAEAHTVLADACDRLRALQHRDISYPAALPAAVEAAAVAGELSAAEGLYVELTERVKALDRPNARIASDYCRGLVAVVRGDDDEARDALMGSAEAYDRLGVPLEAARARLHLGGLLRRTGQRGRARETLMLARDAFGRSGAAGLVARTEEELSRIGGRAASPTALTPAEAQVVELVVQGMRNAEVARQLHLSVKTVETHLRHAFQKTGVRSRTELARTWSHPPAATVSTDAHVLR